MDRNLLLPATLGGFLILSLCFVEQFYLRDWWSKPGVEAELMGKRFEQVPKEIGDWEGENLSVDEIVKNTAGAVNYVSRLYKNKETGREVKLWLIVGHSRDICRHTPNICYPQAGFRQEGLQLPYEVQLPDGEVGKFFTAKFIKGDDFGRHAERVFWAWNHPNTEQFQGKWEAPEDPRKHYGLSRALYKLYFTAAVLGDESAAADSSAAEFAKLMLPEVNKALFPELHKITAEATPAEAATADGEEKPADSDAADAADAPKEEAAPAESAAE